MAWIGGASSRLSMEQEVAIMEAVYDDSDTDSEAAEDTSEGVSGE